MKATRAPSEAVQVSDRSKSRHSEAPPLISKKRSSMGATPGKFKVAAPPPKERSRPQASECPRSSRVAVSKPARAAGGKRPLRAALSKKNWPPPVLSKLQRGPETPFCGSSLSGLRERRLSATSRSEERRVGTECRSRCDWSSDVCSSDLELAAAGAQQAPARTRDSLLRIVAERPARETAVGHLYRQFIHRKAAHQEAVAVALLHHIVAAGKRETPLVAFGFCHLRDGAARVVEDDIDALVARREEEDSARRQVGEHHVAGPA